MTIAILAHEHCNQQKSDSLPDWGYIEKLVDRNEHFIASNHPLKQKFVEQLGRTAAQRSGFVRGAYRDATSVIPYTWKGIRGYDPSSETYRSYIRQMNYLKQLSR